MRLVRSLLLAVFLIFVFSARFTLSNMDAPGEASSEVNDEMIIEPESVVRNIPLEADTTVTDANSKTHEKFTEETMAELDEEIASLDEEFLSEAATKKEPEEVSAPPTKTTTHTQQKETPSPVAPSKSGSPLQPLFAVFSAVQRFITWLIMLPANSLAFLLSGFVGKKN